MTIITFDVFAEDTHHPVESTQLIFNTKTMACDTMCEAVQFVDSGL